MIQCIHLQPPDHSGGGDIARIFENHVACRTPPSLQEKNIMVPPYDFYPKMTFIYIHHARGSTITQNFSALRVMVKLDITQNLRIVDVGQKKSRQIEKLLMYDLENHDASGRIVRSPCKCMPCIQVQLLMIL